jgi:putative Holliday junction resolvase
MGRCGATQMRDPQPANHVYGLIAQKGVMETTSGIANTPFPSWHLVSLDVGNARIGVARSDESGIVVTPHGVIRRKPEPEALAKIARIIIGENAVGLIVGLPLRLNGEFSDQTHAVVAFVERLRPFVDVPIVMWDERYTTTEAERILRERGVRRERWKEQIDAIAATVILQDYLDSQNAPPAPSRPWDDDA